MISSASTEFQRKSPQTNRNVNEILTLHEELLRQVRNVMLDSELKSDNDIITIPRHKEHSRWNSVESPVAGTGAGPMHMARRSMEATMSRHSKRDMLISEPREVAEVAKVFDRLVSTI